MFTAKFWWFVFLSLLYAENIRFQYIKMHIINKFNLLILLQLVTHNDKVKMSLCQILKFVCKFGENPKLIWSHKGINQSERGKLKEGGGQPECFHGDWLSATPLRGQRSLTRRSICHAASGRNQSRERCQEKRTNQRKEWRQVSGEKTRSGKAVVPFVPL